MCILEALLQNNNLPALLLDVDMMVIGIGKERTLEQYGLLMERAGLTLINHIQTDSPFWCIEAIRTND